MHTFLSLFELQAGAVQPFSVFSGSSTVDMSSLMDGEQTLAHCGGHCQSKAKKSRPRHLHQSTLKLGDAAPCYTTTHNQVGPLSITDSEESLWGLDSVCSGIFTLFLLVCQSYSGRSADGRPLIFHLRDPSFPSQHQTRLDLGNNTSPLQSRLQSHAEEVHGPEHISVCRALNTKPISFYDCLQDFEITFLIISDSAVLFFCICNVLLLVPIWARSLEKRFICSINVK